MVDIIIMLYVLYELNIIDLMFDATTNVSFSDKLFTEMESTPCAYLLYKNSRFLGPSLLFINCNNN